MKIIFCGYRSWALDAWRDAMVEDQNVFWLKHDVKIAFSPEELNKVLAEHADVDALFLAGWSWIIPKEVCERYMVVGMHPSDLPAYAGGSPIQHQIMDGITQTKASLFRITPKLDAGAILMKEDMSLAGNMVDVFAELRRVTRAMFVKFTKQLETNTIVEIPQHPEGWGPALKGAQQVSPGLYVERKPLKRIKPESSVLTHEAISKMTARDLYNFIRCHEDPYPNACIEDETGRIEFKLVGFKDAK